DAGGDCLLPKPVAGAPADEDQAAPQRNRARQDLRADQLVDRVVAADVFVDVDQPPVAVEQRRRVQPSGAIEYRLRLAHAFGQLVDPSRRGPPTPPRGAGGPRPAARARAPPPP